MKWNKDTFALKGNLLYTPSPEKLVSLASHYLVCEGGKVSGAFPVLPERYKGISVRDFGDSLIIPGFVDLHMHAPQYAMRGLGMDMELLQWLESFTFPEEARYADLLYAEKAYRIFAQDLKKSSIARACIFGTIHADATFLLMQLLEETGIVAAVGKVNMDVNCPDYYGESTMQSISETVRWIEASQERFQRIFPILTPRFAPVCSSGLMGELAGLQQKYCLPLQSHLSENRAEGQWVQSLFPESRFYGEVYDRFGIFGSHGPTVMAHCVYSSPDEVALMKERGVFIAHCPQSNVNLASVSHRPDRIWMVGKGWVLAAISRAVFLSLASGRSATRSRCRSCSGVCRIRIRNRFHYPMLFIWRRKAAARFSGRSAVLRKGMRSMYWCWTIRFWLHLQDWIWSVVLKGWFIWPGRTVCARNMYRA